MRARVVNYQLGIRRGKQRWSALVSAPTSRISKMMRRRMGAAAWNDFVQTIFILMLHKANA